MNNVEKMYDNVFFLVCFNVFFKVYNFCVEKV